MISPLGVTLLLALVFGITHGFIARNGIETKYFNRILSLLPNVHNKCENDKGIANLLPRHTSVIAGGLLGLSVITSPFPIMTPSWNNGKLGIMSKEMVAVAADRDYTKVKYPLFEEVWDDLNENFFDDQYNGQDWQEVKKKTIKK